MNPPPHSWCRTFRMVACPVWCPSWHRSLGPPSCWIRSLAKSCWLIHLSMSSNNTCSKFTDTPSDKTRGNMMVEEIAYSAMSSQCWLTIFPYFFIQGPWYYFFWSNEPTSSDVQVNICVYIHLCMWYLQWDTLKLTFFFSQSEACSLWSLLRRLHCSLFGHRLLCHSGLLLYPFILHSLHSSLSCKQPSILCDVLHFQTLTGR